MRRFIVLEGEDGKKTALETRCIQKFETAEAARHCWVYYYDTESNGSKMLYVRGTIETLVEIINKMEAEIEAPKELL